jgi:hypothetical protein
MLVLLFSAFSLIFFPQFSFGGETIYAKEIEYFMYKDGKMTRSDGEFEVTYFIEGDKIRRTRVYNLMKNEVIPDDSIYHIQRQLWSDPQLNLSLQNKRVIRAIGQPGTDAIEILSIEFNGYFLQSVRSYSDYFVISRYRIIK